jgi:Na+/H+-dicarboxylate symporter
VAVSDDPAKLKRRANTLVVFTAVAVLIGGVFGWLLPGWLPEDAESKRLTLLVIGFPGDLLMGMLKMMVVPLVVATMVVGVASLGDVRKAGRIGFRTIAYYAITTGMSVLLGIILVNLIQPGVGSTAIAPASGELPTSLMHPKGALESLLLVVKGMFPPNLLKAGVDMNVLGLIVFSVVFGAVLSTMGERGRPVLRFFEGFNEAIMKIVHLIVWYAPIGIASLLMARMGKAGDAFFTQEIPRLAKYMATVITGLAIHVLVTLPLIYWLFKKRNPFRFMLGMAQALLTAFSTASSSATLPITLECAKTNNKISERTAGFVLPLGATINMDGTALYEAVAVIFISQSLGMHLGLGQMVIVFFTATLAAIGAAGIPEAGLVMMAIVLTAVGIDPREAGLILAVDWFLDRFRTAVNVAGDSIGAGVVDHLEQRDAGPLPAAAA